MNSTIKLFAEIVPITIFFILYKSFGLIHATSGLVIASLVSLIIIYYIEKKTSYVTLFSSIILAIFGGITIYTGDSKFIKLKPTIINLTFSTILFIGILFNKGLIKYLCGNAFELSEKSWIKFSYRWAVFFLSLALTNELVWRNFSENTWIKFKVFGIIPLTILFMILQIPFLHKSKIEPTK